jgi:D-glycero-D-manno-heptose 1,7-bisphosphate phosphatase
MPVGGGYAVIRQAVILAGGLGTRLGEITRQTPKPLVPVGGRPFLEYLIWNLRRHGIENILLSIGYLADRIIEHFGDGSRYGVAIDYVIEEEPAGTGGALALALEKLDSLFLVLNGDTLFDLNYLDLALLLKHSPAKAAVALRQVADAGRYGRVNLAGDHISDFGEKTGCGPGLVNGGVYVMNRSVLAELPTSPCSLEKELFPRLALAGELAGKAYSGFFIDIGLPLSLRDADVLVPAWRKKPAVFLDRDGVLNVDFGHVHRPADFVWLEGAREAVKWLNDNGCLAIVVTNQAGIAKGFYTEEEYLKFSSWISRELRRVGAHLDDTYYCPHHPTEGKEPYLKHCDCRKPAPGLLRRAIDDWQADEGGSVFIGDKKSDLLAAQAAGIQGALFTGGNLLDFLRSVWSEDGCRGLSNINGKDGIPE